MTLLKKRLLEFREWLGQQEAGETVLAIVARFDELIDDTPIPNQVNLSLNEENVEQLRDALDREEIAIGQRSLTGYIGLRRKPRGIIGAEVTVCNLAPNEAVLLGLYLFGLGGMRCPEFLDQFGLKIEPGSAAVKS